MTDVSTQVTNGILGVVNLLKNIVNPIGILAIVSMGIYLIACGGDSRAWQKIKVWAVTLVVGLILINASPAIVAWLQTLGVNAGN